MRYLPKSKVKQLIANDGSLIKIRSNSQPYQGPYIQTSEGELFAGTHNTIGEQLYIDDSLIYNLPTNEKRFNTLRGTKQYNRAKKSIKKRLEKSKTPAVVKSKPTENDYVRGYYQRYFLKRINGDRYIEIDKKTYNDISQKKPKYDYNLYDVGSLTWYLTDRLRKKSLFSLNATSIKSQSRKHPKLFLLFPILNEFQRPSTEVIEDLYTTGGELYYGD